MMNFIELYICVILLSKTVDAQVNIPAVTPPRNGDTVTLTCTISTFILPAAWKNNDSGAHFTTCFNTSKCSPLSDGVRYNFSATSSSIIVTISSFDSTADTFTWKCEHNGTAATYHITAASITNTSPTTTPQLALIIGVGVCGSVLILLTSIIIICCCCQCCCLYHCRKEKDRNKYGSELEQINHNQYAKNHTRAKDGTPNPAIQAVKCHK